MSNFTVKQAILWGADKLRERKIPSARIDSEILLSLVLEQPREAQISKSKCQIKPKILKKFKGLIERRTKNEPIAYIVGKKEFYGLDFLVTKDVLVPRPETELLVDLVIKSLPTIHYPLSTILDLGTGSGCIGLTLAKHLPKAKVICADISKKALLVARKNARNLKLKSVKFVLSDLLSEIKESPDIIVANLPYLTRAELAEPSIKKEPKLALYGGQDGLALYERLFRQIKRRLSLHASSEGLAFVSPLLLFCEISESQGKKITALARRYFPKAEIEIKKDLARRDRVMMAKL
ncbi:peptide chain release factor N(5)-glutamine methyltransferase [Candidatus Microgenomates bacterium]|nr:peptide chain release factor N(5)-glutamine methyltransferase [Candidatus Microgenomates bacterium]